MFDEEEADFSGITGHKDLYVSDVIHQAKMEVYNVKKKRDSDAEVTVWLKTKVYRLNISL